MANLKEQLVKLGSVQPDLRKHIRPILEEINKTAAGFNAKLYVELKTPEKIAAALGLNRPVYENLELSDSHGLSGFMVFSGLANMLDRGGSTDRLLKELRRSLRPFNISLYGEEGDDVILEFDTK